MAVGERRQEARNMALASLRVPKRILPMLLLCFMAKQSLASSNTYHHSVSVDGDGKPSLKLTKDSALPITAFAIVEFPSLGMEGRTYSDVYTSTRDETIPPGASIVHGLSFFPGSDVTKVRAEVRAVIFKDGSSAGDPVWINAILARRLRFYDRTLSLHDLLSERGAPGIHGRRLWRCCGPPKPMPKSNFQKTICA